MTKPLIHGVNSICYCSGLTRPYTRQRNSKNTALCDFIAPMTTTLRRYPTRVAVRFDKKNGMIAIDQICTIDKTRIVTSLGQLSAKQIEACKAVLKETFVD